MTTNNGNMRFEIPLVSLVTLCSVSFACVPEDGGSEDGADEGESGGDAAADTDTDTDIDTETTSADTEGASESETDTEGESGTEGESESESEGESESESETDTEGESETGAFDPPEISCAESLLGQADLSFHLLQAECFGTTCTWDYDPAGAVMTQIAGEYDPLTGEFSWTVAYDPEHWRTSTTVSGTAVISEAGDESSSYSATTIDMLGAEILEDISLERSGCELVKTTTREGKDFVLDGSFTSTAFTYTEGQIPPLWTLGSFPVDAAGTRTSEGYEETFQYYLPFDEESDQEFVWNYSHSLTGDDDGYSEATFSQWNWVSSWSRNGTCSWSISGTQFCVVEANSEDWTADVQWTEDYSHNGEGIFSAWFYSSEMQDWVWQNCPITMVDGVCSYLCPLGQTNDCRYFLME
ncbi:hypothetical protein G6O69_11840 [Pseudenhygromyxa sp. WMMC2535]|uniref:hypothetical protein n=1 Tax=Pseudenhygromyxa sp. WMMC2535 TaxID=2712867 RepID=UPI0015952E3E|nr:hypothetical protein [Pseudenhygromyxa sp. WMMC2535]NVB38523.1 hypothetical protein [Pseudenhygromyxa sp. WMMC2535]